MCLSDTLQFGPSSCFSPLWCGVVPPKTTNANWTEEEHWKNIFKFLKEPRGPWFFSHWFDTTIISRSIPLWRFFHMMKYLQWELQENVGSSGNQRKNGSFAEGVFCVSCTFERSHHVYLHFSVFSSLWVTHFPVSQLRAVGLVCKHLFSWFNVSFFPCAFVRTHCYRSCFFIHPSHL